MTDIRENVPRIARLIENGLVRCRPLGPLAASAGRLPYPPPRDRIEGMLLGLAMGDGLGNTSEGMKPGARRAAYGAIRDYLPNQYANYRSVGLPSDDTQLAFWTIESILVSGGVDPADLAERFANGQVYGSGGAFREFVASYRAGLGWESAGRERAGNGALTRTAPLLLPSLVEGGESLVADIVLGSMVTHNDSASIAACAAFGLMLRELLAAETPPPRDWWAERFASLAALVETGKEYQQRGGESGRFSGTLSNFVTRSVPAALDAGSRVLEACESWLSGAYLLETVPSALFILARCATDPEEAIARAVNDTKDNDSVAAIVGSAVGALHGASALPRRWLGGLTGRTREDDDGAAQRLAAEAAKRFGI